MVHRISKKETIEELEAQIKDLEEMKNEAKQFGWTDENEEEEVTWELENAKKMLKEVKRSK